MEKFSDAISENELLLMRYYNDSLSKIKKQLFDATANGTDTKHLKQLKENIENELIKLNKKFQWFSKDTIAKTYKKGIKEQENAFKQLHIQFTPVKAKTYAQFAGLHKEAVKTLAINTYKPLKRVVDVIGRDCIEYLERTNFNDTQSILKKLLKFFPDSEELRETGLASVQGVVNGNITWQKGIREFQETFMKQEIFKVPYYKKDGTLHAMVNMADYAELVARTTSAEAYRKGAENSILETFGDQGDLVQVNGHSTFPTSPCLPFEDAILSLTGKTKGYTTLDEAKAQGLFHPNCIHHFGVTLDVLDEYDRIEAGKPQGTKLKEIEKPPTKQRAKAEPESTDKWNMKDILATYKGNDDLVKRAFSTVTVDDDIADILGNINKLPAVKVVNDRGQGYFNNATSLISANSEVVFLHEFGHSLDYGIIKASSTKYGYFSKQFADVVEKHRIKRMDKFPEAVKQKFTSLKQEAYKKYGKDFYEHLKQEGWNAVSDIFCALTNGNMFGRNYNWAIAGHSAKYYRMAGTKEKEIFAQYVRLRLQNKTEALDFLQENVPDLLKTLEKSFKLYAEELKKL